MNFLSPLLLSISSNLDTFTVGTSYGIKKIHMTKSTILLIAIITSIGTFISMYFGAIIGDFFSIKIANIFGSVLLSLVGVYFIVEHIRIEKKYRGEDISYYVESNSKYKGILEDPIILDTNNSHEIELNKALLLSFALTLNNLGVGFAASITGINIPLSIFFNFIGTVIGFYLGYFINNNYFSKLFMKYATLASGVILIILGLYEIFI